MKWSIKLGRVWGINVYIHLTFLIILGWVALSFWMQAKSVAATLLGVGFFLALFLCVLLHEFGHALTAKRYGIKTRDITLLPIGGIARLERMPDDPWEEFWVALAGPAVNVVIAGAIYLWLALTGGFQPLSEFTLFSAGAFWQRLMIVNVFLVLFNLLPAFPMDGGRVLRALLATRMEYTKATNIAATLGQAMAFFFGFVGFFTNPFLIFIALFVWIGASQEASLAQIKAWMGGIPVSRAMLTEFRILAPEDSLSRAIEMILAGSQQDFPVARDGKVLGVLTRSDLLVALAKHGQNALVGDAMQKDFVEVDASEMLGSAFLRLQTCNCHTLPVVRRGELVGLLTMENLGEFVMIKSALQEAGKEGSQRERREARATA